MTAAPTRRAVLASAGAVLVAAGAALAPIAVTTPLPAADNPDAALLAACAKFEATERAIFDIYDNPNLVISDDEADALAEPLEATLDHLLDVLDGLLTHTAEGLRARIRLLSVHNGHGGFSWDEPHMMSGRLLGQVMREGGGAAPSATLAAEHSDAELFTACEHFARQEAEYGRLSIATDWPANAPRTPAMAALEQEFAALSEAHHSNGFWIAEYSPKTFAGIRAKARAVLVYVGENDPTHDMIGALERSVCRDLAGDGGVA